MMKSASDLCDAYERGIVVLELLFTDFSGRQQSQGEAFTLKCFEDNSKVGKVQVPPETIVGWLGFGIYGSNRDLDELGALNLVFTGSQHIR